MTILLTGASGFIGSRYLELMTPLSEPVLAVDKIFPQTEPNPKLPIEYYFCDLLDEMQLKTLFKDYKFNAIIHLAGISRVNSPDALTVNVLLAKNILSSVINLPKERFPRIVFAGTAAEYGDIPFKEVPATEDHYTETVEPYAASKAMCAILAKQYRKDFGVPVSVLRFGNVYGSGLFSERLIPTLLKKMFKGEVITLTGNGETRRPWIYIDDVCDVINKVLLWMNGGASATFNVTETREASLKFLTTILAAELQDQCLKAGLMIPPLNLAFQEEEKGPKRIAIDPYKLKLLLKWTPKVSLQMGLQQTVAGFLKGQLYERNESVNLRCATVEAESLSRSSGAIYGELQDKRD